MDAFFIFLAECAPWGCAGEDHTRKVLEWKLYGKAFPEVRANSYGRALVSCAVPFWSFFVRTGIV